MQRKNNFKVLLCLTGYLLNHKVLFENWRESFLLNFNSPLTGIWFVPDVCCDSWNSLFPDLFSLPRDSSPVWRLLLGSEHIFMMRTPTCSLFSASTDSLSVMYQVATPVISTTARRDKGASSGCYIRYTEKQVICEVSVSSMKQNKSRIETGREQEVGLVREALSKRGKKAHRYLEKHLKLSHV